MNDLHKLSLTRAKKGLLNKEFTAKELTQSCIDIYQSNYAHDGYYITTCFDEALLHAEKSDENIQSGNARLLEGLPIGQKDLFCTKNIQTTAASKILKGFVPTYESTVSQNMLNDGVICLGKLNLDEFAMGSANLTSHFGPVKNPWSYVYDGQDDVVPGGSSGGSAAAVASGSVLAATGTDTGGSIRQPASFTGIVGLKPTYGRCSRFGIVAFASSLDQAGPMTKTVEDAALLISSMAGYDANDSTSYKNTCADDFKIDDHYDLRGKKIGIPREYRVDNMDPIIIKEWEKGMDALRARGAEIVDISLPHTHYALPTYYIIAPAEASSNLARYDGVRYGYRTDKDFKDLNEMYAFTRAEGFGSEVQRRIFIGTYVLSAGYYDAFFVKAMKVRRKIMNDFDKVFKDVDAILTPTAPSAAFGMNAKDQDPVTMYLNDVFTVPASLAGLPAISLPSGLSDNGLPLGLQLIGNRYDEKTILNIAHQLEKDFSFKSLVDSAQIKK